MKPLSDITPPDRRSPSTDSAADTTIRISRNEQVKCPICQDAGWLRADVPFGHPSFGRIYQCVCKRREQEEKRSQKLRSLSNLETFTQQTFEQFDPDIPGLNAAFEAALDYAQEPAHRWLVLTGPTGVGKTHLAVAIAKYVMDFHQMTAYFAVVPDLLDHLRATFDPESGQAYDDRFSSIRNAPLLVLDDLGTENATPWAREKLYQIINHRYMEAMPTVITSNVDLRRVDDRIASRMLDHRLSNHVEIAAEDFRRPGEPRSMRKMRR